MRAFSCGPANLQNQLNTCYGYDSAGNLVSKSPETYTYDAENRLVSTAGWTYVYDGDGNRVRKFSSTTGTLYWRDTSGEVLGENDQTGSPLSDYVFFNGQRIARVNPKTLAVHYYFSDHLGTHTVVTNATGTCEQDIEFYPYGGQRKQYCSTPVAQNYKFTGKERDTESGNDYFGARYNASTIGRFVTPDWSEKPIAIPFAGLNSPQTLNLYGYVDNNPLIKNDPNGHCTVEGQDRGFFWCVFHAIGLVETPKERETRLLETAKGFIRANNYEIIEVNGHWQRPSDSSDEQILAWWQQYKKDNQDNVFQGGHGLAFAAVGALTTRQATDLANYLGFKRVKDPPFDSHGQAVFEKNGQYITPDVDGHSGGTWKLFDRRGNRIATTDPLLEPIGK